MRDSRDAERGGDRVRSVLMRPRALCLINVMLIMRETSRQSAMCLINVLLRETSRQLINVLLRDIKTAHQCVAERDIKTARPVSSRQNALCLDALVVLFRGFSAPGLPGVCACAWFPSLRPKGCGRRIQICICIPDAGVMRRCDDM